MKVLIENSSNIDEVVFEPFMGVGSTIMACIELDRKYIGCEIDEKYYNIAKNRIEMPRKRNVRCGYAQQVQRHQRKLPYTISVPTEKSRQLKQCLTIITALFRQTDMWHMVMGIT